MRIASKNSPLSPPRGGHRHLRRADGNSIASSPSTTLAADSASTPLMVGVGAVAGLQAIHAGIPTPLSFLTSPPSPCLHGGSPFGFRSAVFVSDFSEHCLGNGLEGCPRKPTTPHCYPPMPPRRQTRSPISATGALAPFQKPTCKGSIIAAVEMVLQGYDHPKQQRSVHVPGTLH